MKTTKSKRNSQPASKRVATQRQPCVSKCDRLQGAGGNAADRAGPARIQTRARRKQIQEFAVAAIMAGRPFPVAESLILAVIQGMPIQCSETELRRELGYLEEKEVIHLDRIKGGPWLAWIAGQATVLMQERNLVGSRDIHITISAAVEAASGTPGKSPGLPGALARPK